MPTSSTEVPTCAMPYPEIMQRKQAGDAVGGEVLPAGTDVQVGQACQQTGHGCKAHIRCSQAAVEGQGAQGGNGPQGAERCRVDLRAVAQLQEGEAGQLLECPTASCPDLDRAPWYVSKGPEGCLPLPSSHSQLGCMTQIKTRPHDLVWLNGLVKFSLSLLLRWAHLIGLHCSEPWARDPDAEGI